jgi:hypothetical protein
LRDLVLECPDGCEIVPTAKPTHFVVRHPRGVVIIATLRNDVPPVYVSRIVRALGMREGDKDE